LKIFIQFEIFLLQFHFYFIFLILKFITLPFRLPFATAITKIGLMRSIDWTNQWAIGLVQLSGGKVAISSVDTGSKLQRYADLTGNIVVNSLGDQNPLLVCETP
jgi:hypothetical protein